MYSHILAILDAQTEPTGALPNVAGRCGGERTSGAHRASEGPLAKS